MPEKKKPGVIAVNRKAYHDFTVLQTLEAGISLQGTEVKSIRMGKINLKDGFGFLKNGEVYLRNVHISPYLYGNRTNHHPTRERKLLLHKSEIKKLSSKVKEKGLTLVPLRVYLKRGKIKIEMGLCKGKKFYDKKEEIKKKDQNKELKKTVGTSHLSGRLK